MIEDAHLVAALEEALAVVEEMERANARSAAAAWWSCAQILCRLLATPSAFLEGEVVDFGVCPVGWVSYGGLVAPCGLLVDLTVSWTLP